MFTGLVQITGMIADRLARASGCRLTIAAALPPPELGESVAVNGVCLTVAARSEQGFVTDVSVETLARTTLGRLPVGAQVNLERALRAGDALGGHFVSGHIDGVAVVQAVSAVGADRRVSLRPSGELLRFLAEKGSVALDGVSLTINALHAGAFEIMLIPHTLAVTTLKSLTPGTELNLEVDLLARYTVHWLETSRSAASPLDGKNE